MGREIASWERYHALFYALSAKAVKRWFGNS